MKARDYAKVAEEMAEYGRLTPAQMSKKVKALEKEMHKAARDLEFERAAAIRDQIKDLRERGLAI
jgi:excinuclease ABC subunit B